MSLFSSFIETDDLQIGEEIGRGTYGIVYKGKYLKSGKLVAIKILKNILISKEDQTVFLREAMIHSTIHHSGIVEFIGFRFPLCDNEIKKEKKEKKKERKEIISNPIIVTEYVTNGSLKDINERYLKSRKVLTNYGPTERAIIIFGIAYAMCKAHSANVIHQDLTIANILLDEKMHPKIADFGCARLASDKTDFSMVGTPFSMAPEVIRCEHHDKPADVYSFGILLISLFTNEVIMNDGLPIKSVPDFLSRIEEGVRPRRPHGMPYFYWKLAKKCWNDDPSQRPTFERVVSKLLQNDEAALQEKGVTTDLERLFSYQKEIMKDHKKKSNHFPNSQTYVAKKIPVPPSNKFFYSSYRREFRKSSFNWKRH